MTQILELQALDSRGQSWYAEFPPNLKYNTDNFLWYAKTDYGPGFIFVHALYHASLAILYYSLVLSISSDEQQTSAISVSLLTTSALEHANAISAIVRDLFRPEWDVSRTPGFAGYSAYIATSVQLSYLWSRSPPLAASARQNIANNLRLLKELGPYWAVVDQVVL